MIPAISMKAIKDAWDPMMRLIASIKLGRVSVSWALARNGSAGRGAVLQRGLDQLGRLLRTIFLCDYLTKPAFRRELHTLLNRGESVHLLQRAIFYGTLRPERGRRTEEMVTISGAHALLTNLVIAWNTMKHQETRERLKLLGQGITDDVMRRIGPVNFGNINMRGRMSFPIDRYAEDLLARKTPPGRAAKK